MGYVVPRGTIPDYATKLAMTQPMASLITGTTPDYRLPFDQWYKAAFQRTGSSQHLTGGNPMLSSDAGGVVDTNMSVYGTSKVRVVDGSIFPYSPSLHPMGVIYAIALYAARIFQGIAGGGGLTVTEQLPVRKFSASATATSRTGSMS